jgi:hypothetical protein
MTPSDLKFHFETKQNNTLFFSRNNMKWAKDTMANYGVRDAGEYWELYRKRPVKMGLQTSHYFHKVTFEHISDSTYERRIAEAKKGA